MKALGIQRTKTKGAFSKLLTRSEAFEEMIQALEQFQLDLEHKKKHETYEKYPEAYAEASYYSKCGLKPLNTS